MRKLLILVDCPVDTRLTQSVVAARWDVHIANTAEKARNKLEQYRFHVGLALLDSCNGGRIPPWIEDIINAQKHVKWVQVLPRDCLKSPRIARLITSRCYDYHSLPIDLQRLMATLGHAAGMAELAAQVHDSSRGGSTRRRIFGDGVNGH